MNAIRRTLLTTAIVLLAAPLLYAQVTEPAVIKQLEKLRALPIDQRSEAAIKLAGNIRTLPAGAKKVGLADDLAHVVTAGDQGANALQAAADALSQALAETPIPAKKDQPPEPYFELARLVRYENAHATLNDALFAQASHLLAGYDADVQKADFTLSDLKGKKYTLSELRGKIVLINFWATTCNACVQELPDLDIIYTHYQSQGLVILTITPEDYPVVTKFIRKWEYNPPVLIDADGNAAKQFHVDVEIVTSAATSVGKGKQPQVDTSSDVKGLPRTFVFDREGKLAAQAIDQRTQRQFFEMLAAGGLHP
jgi:peroxiredoxin